MYRQFKFFLLIHFTLLRQNFILLQIVHATHVVHVYNNKYIIYIYIYERVIYYIYMWPHIQ